MSDFYIVEGEPSDGHYGTILLYHGVSRVEALDSTKWAGDFSEGATIHVWRGERHRQVRFVGIDDDAAERKLQRERGAIRDAEKKAMGAGS